MTMFESGETGAPLIRSPPFSQKKLHLIYYCPNRILSLQLPFTNHVRKARNHPIPLPIQPLREKSACNPATPISPSPLLTPHSV